MLLESLANWGPFQIDALGLITIFGAEAIRKSIGNFTQSRICEYLPVLGSHVIASNQITDPVPGFVLYNITDGIVATDIAPWFTYWLQSYPITYTATTITLKADGRPMSTARHSGSLALGVFCTAPLIILTILMGDKWGIANFASMIAMVILRQLMLWELRLSIDKAVEKSIRDPGDDVKALLTLPDGRAVTILGSRAMVVNCLLTDPRPLHPQLYKFFQFVAWIAFGAQAIALGMSTLFHQILCVVIMLSGTFLTAIHIGDLPSRIGTKLHLGVDLGNPDWFRSPAYARFDLTETEEETMVRWNLMPQRSNKFWWERFRTTYVPQRAPLYPHKCATRQQETEKPMEDVER
ncbi:hypothetical protein FHETE_7174 [Fusarium heterosporum]|uniref:Uncharacterized protein n=1 Tax=Fusarium heterosporum TaxID=42747 RepID=A0A8H5WLI1_FUSHE|nr:hypothetical protein FHETE_7174 [Fusarium heterosporum]